MLLAWMETNRLAALPAREDDAIAQGDEHVAGAGHVHLVPANGLQGFADLVGDRQHHILLIEAIPRRPDVRAAMAGIDDDHGPGALLGRGLAVVLVRLLLAAHRRRGDAGEEARLVGRRQVQRKVHSAPLCLQGVLVDAHRLRRVDHDAGLARSEQPVAEGADQAGSPLARPHGQAEIHIGQVENHAVRVGQRGDVVGDAGRQQQREAGARAVARDLGLRRGCGLLRGVLGVVIGGRGGDGLFLGLRRQPERWWLLRKGHGLGGRLRLADLGLPRRGFPKLARLRRHDRNQKRPRRTDGHCAPPCVPGAQPRPIRRSHRSAPSLATAAMPSLTGTFNHMLAVSRAASMPRSGKITRAADPGDCQSVRKCCLPRLRQRPRKQ